MQRGLLAQLTRRQRQLDTLRQMLQNVGQLIGYVEQLAQDRELTTEEREELDALHVRRDRIEKSLGETEQLARAR